MTTKPKAFMFCSECHGSGRQRVQGVLTTVHCEKCDGLGYISAKYYRKMLAAQRLARQARTADR